MPLEPITTRLEAITEWTPTVRTFRLRIPEKLWTPFQPGQFCLVQIPQEGPDKRKGGEKKVSKKPYSICSAPHEVGFVDLCIKRVEGGHATNWFWDLKKGDSVTITIPYGGFLLKQPIDFDPVFIATGTGLAPLRSMIRTIDHASLLPSGRELWLIFGVRYTNEVLYDAEWRDLAGRHKNFHYLPTVSRPDETKGTWKGETGYVQEKLKKFITDPKGKEIYVCGLIPMIEAVRAAAAEIGFTPAQIHFEKWV